MRLVEEKLWTQKTANSLTNEKDNVESWTVFLILFTFNTESRGYMLFLQSFILAANHVFHVIRILKQIKVESFCPSREAQSPEGSVFLSFSPQLPQDNSLLFSYNHSYEHSSILFCTQLSILPHNLRKAFTCICYHIKASQQSTEVDMPDYLFLQFN